MLPEAYANPIVLEESRLWNEGMAKLGDTAPLIPIFSTCTILLWHVPRGSGAASGQEPCELLLESVKEQNKRGVDFVGFIFASCCFGVWEEKLGKSAVSPQSYHVCLEKVHVLREQRQYQDNSEHDGGTLPVAVTWKAEAGPHLLCEQPWRPVSREKGLRCLGSHDAV